MKIRIGALLTFVVVFFFQAAAQNPKLSLTANRLANQQSEQSSRSRLIKSLQSTDEQVNVVVHFYQEPSVADLAAIGASIGTQADGVATVTLPAANIEKLAALADVKHVRLGHKVRKVLNTAVSSVNADSVHKGLGNLAQPYKGAGVVVGVCDYGLDYLHPMFSDGAGGTRIKRVWNQNAKSGTKPSGFTYGAEYTTYAQLQSLKASATDESHGTHVTGIAAGSGGNLGTYVGIAPEADIVFVELSDGDSDVIDGISYIFKYAKSVGKPAVVNLSLGTHYGPHDGTSEFDVMLDALVDSGLIVVGAIGNEGDTKLHAQHTFASAVDTIRTIVSVDSDSNYDPETIVEVWGDVGKDFKYSIEVWDKSTKRKVTTQNFSFVSTASNGAIANKTFTVGSGGTKATIEIEAASYKASSNSNNRAMAELYVYNSKQSRYGVALVLLGSAGTTLHVWNAAYDYDLSALVSSSKWMAGNNSYTAGEIGATANRIIATGAYNHRTSYTDYQGRSQSYNSYGSVGQVTGFSSLGPTLDGRVKPDVLAPGLAVISSVNSRDTESGYTASDPSVVAKEPSGSYYYAEMSGTSMATPVVTGAVALMLAANSKLTPEDAKVFLHKHAVVDSYIQGLDKNQVGYGKLNVARMMFDHSLPDYNMRVAFDELTYDENIFDVSVLVSNAQQGVRSVMLYFGVSAGDTTLAECAMTGNGSSYVANYTPTFSFTTVYITAVVYDNAGNRVAISRSYTKKSSMVLTISNLSYANKIFNVSAQVSGSQHNIKSVKLYLGASPGDTTLAAYTMGGYSGAYSTSITTQSTLATLYFTVIAYDVAGNRASASQSYTRSSTSVLANTQNIDFALFPNPASTEITLQLADDAQLKKVEVFDMSGILQLSISANKLNVSILQNGVYVVRATTNKGVGSRLLYVAR